MGNYTGLRFTAQLNEQGERMVLYMENWRANIDWADPDELRTNEWREAALECDAAWALPWSRVERAIYIPCGVLCYMPDEWDDYPNEFDRLTGTWHVCCSLKNYNNEIEQFLAEVLPHMLAKRCTAYMLYEHSTELAVVVEPESWEPGFDPGPDAYDED